MNTNHIALADINFEEVYGEYEYEDDDLEIDSVDEIEHNSLDNVIYPATHSNNNVNNITGTTATNSNAKLEQQLNELTTSYYKILNDKQAQLSKNNDSQDDVTCSVCFEDLTNAKYVKCLHCNHIFCTSCLRDCIRNTRYYQLICPSCLNMMDLSEIVRVLNKDFVNTELISILTNNLKQHLDNNVIHEVMPVINDLMFPKGTVAYDIPVSLQKQMKTFCTWTEDSFVKVVSEAYKSLTSNISTTTLAVKPSLDINIEAHWLGQFSQDYKSDVKEINNILDKDPYTKLLQFIVYGTTLNNVNSTLEYLDCKELFGEIIRVEDTTTTTETQQTGQTEDEDGEEEQPTEVKKSVENRTRSRSVTRSKSKTRSPSRSISKLRRGGYITYGNICDELYTKLFASTMNKIENINTLLDSQRSRMSALSNMLKAKTPLGLNQEHYNSILNSLCEHYLNMWLNHLTSSNEELLTIVEGKYKKSSDVDSATEENFGDDLKASSKIKRLTFIKDLHVAELIVIMFMNDLSDMVKHVPIPTLENTVYGSFIQPMFKALFKHLEQTTKFKRAPHGRLRNVFTENNIVATLVHYNDPQVVVKKPVTRVKIFKCPSCEVGFVEDYDGDYICNHCDENFCKSCGEKLVHKHVCKESIKADFKLLIKETKPCPKCGARIYKTSGCNDMFCTNCKTGFNWMTGKLITSNFHNPHRMDWLQSLSREELREVNQRTYNSNNVNTQVRTGISGLTQYQEDSIFTNSRIENIDIERNWFNEVDQTFLTKEVLVSVDALRSWYNHLDNTLESNERNGLYNYDYGYVNRTYVARNTMDQYSKELALIQHELYKIKIRTVQGLKHSLYDQHIISRMDGVHTVDDFEYTYRLRNIVTREIEKGIKNIYSRRLTDMLRQCLPTLILTCRSLKEKFDDNLYKSLRRFLRVYEQIIIHEIHEAQTTMNNKLGFNGVSDIVGTILIPGVLLHNHKSNFSRNVTNEINNLLLTKLVVNKSKNASLPLALNCESKELLTMLDQMMKNKMFNSYFNNICYAIYKVRHYDYHRYTFDITDLFTLVANVIYARLNPEMIPETKMGKCGPSRQWWTSNVMKLPIIAYINGLNTININKGVKNYNEYVYKYILEDEFYKIIRIPNVLSDVMSRTQYDRHVYQ